MFNCTTDTLYNSHFSKWTPLIGIYIATATLVYVVAIVADLVKGLWNKQYWIPSEYVSLNSVSLAILGAATKLSMDLSTAMPRHTDQLAKLGTSAFMCIALASIHPSLGKLENSELLSNTVALFILVISSITSLCIQLRTGVIYTFKTAHIIMLTIMTLLLLEYVFLAMVLPMVKCLYQNQYLDHSAQETQNDEENEHLRTKKLEGYLRKFSMLAHSGCPHFLLGRSFRGNLPTIYGVVAAIVFFWTQITSIIHGDKFLASTSGSSISAYNWSVLWILVTQTISLGVGSIILCIRGCYYAMLYSKGVDSSSWKGESKQFWMKIDQNAAATRYYGDFIDFSQHKSLVYKLLIPYSYLCFYFIIFVNITAKILRILKLFYRGIISCFLVIRRWINCKPPHIPGSTARPDNQASVEEEVSEHYISVSPGEKSGSVKWIIKSISNTTQKYMSVKERKTKHLEELLTKYLSPDFGGVASFDGVEVASLDASQVSPPNCWSLPVVTLTHIAIAIARPNVDRHSVVELIKGVNEGLVFAKLLEDKFNNQPHFYNARWAAYALWRGGYGPWFKRRVDPSFQNKRPIEILESIATSAENEIKKHAGRPTTQLKNRSLYRLCKTILLEHRNETQDDEVSVLEEQRNENIEPTQDDRVYLSSERIFEKLRATIADILGACLTNLNRYILMECSDSLSIEKRREAACRILKFFGDTKKIMEIVEAKEIPVISPERMVFIDEWRNCYSSRGRREA